LVGPQSGRAVGDGVRGQIVGGDPHSPGVIPVAPAVPADETVFGGVVSVQQMS
jgi:hypothetical protein